LVLQNYEDGTETEVLKLDAADGSVNYQLEMFEVYDANDNLIWLSPAEGSYYDNLWNLTGVTLDFTVEKFTKHKISIDVLCFEPYEYENFGFTWFDFDQIKVKSLCFYGDVCTKFHEYFHEDGSPYYGQSNYEGYDFPAIFKIEITDATGNILNDENINSNLDWQGVGEPLCIEYPDYVGQVDNYTFTIYLLMPDGVYEEVHAVDFTAEQYNNIDGDTSNNFGGEDGVFDFVVGNCSYNGNDADIELPAYIPIPDEVSFKLSGPVYDSGYVYIEFSGIGVTTYQIQDATIYSAWCGDQLNSIYLDTWYDATVYSSLGTVPAPYNSYNWGALNWLANNLDSYTPEQIQEAIWNIIHGTAPNALAIDALTHPGFIPTVGDMAIVLFDPTADDSGSPEIQMVFMRIDP